MTALTRALSDPCASVEARSASGFAAAILHPPLWCTLLVCAIVLVARQPDLARSPQFWAEDGPVFFLQSRTLGVVSLLTPSAGYFHTVPRLVAWFAARVDPTLSPAIYVGAAALLTLYVAALTQSVRCPLPRSVGYALAVVLVPDAGEVLLTLTNVQWLLAPALLLILIGRDAECAAQRAHDIVAVALLGLTGPFVIGLAPLFAWRALQRRTQFSTRLLVIAAACATIQAVTIFRCDPQVADAPIASELLLGIPGVRVGGSLLTGGRIRADAGVLVATILGAVTIGGLAMLAWWRGPARIERIWLALAFAGFLGMALMRCRFVLPAVFHGAGSRYFFPLQLCALWLLVAASCAARPRCVTALRVVLVFVVALNAPRLREPPFADLNWPAFAARIRMGECITVKINPEPWAFTLPAQSNKR